MNLGQEYYYIMQKTKEVKKGFLINLGIDSNSGYVMAYFPIEAKPDEANVDRIEEELIFETEEEAKVKLESITSLIDNAQEIEDTANAKLKDIREDVIGKPRFLDLIGGK